MSEMNRALARHTGCFSEAHTSSKGAIEMDFVNRVKVSVIVGALSSIGATGCAASTGEERGTGTDEAATTTTHNVPSPPNTGFKGPPLGQGDCVPSTEGGVVCFKTEGS